MDETTDEQTGKQYTTSITRVSGFYASDMERLGQIQLQVGNEKLLQRNGGFVNK